MNFFQKLFEGFGSFFANIFVGGSGGGRGGGGAGDSGMYFYVRCNKCGEVIKVRISPTNDLYDRDDLPDGYISPKLVMGQRCYNRIEADFYFGSNRKFKRVDISGGTQVDKAAYDADQAEQAAKKAE